MVIDTSAVSAVLFGEPEGPAFVDALASPERKFMSAFTRLEAAIVVEARKGEAGDHGLASFLGEPLLYKGDKFSKTDVAAYPASDFPPRA